MAEPSTSAGVSLAVISVALLGPAAGPYSLIIFAALAGSLWPLSASRSNSESSRAKQTSDGAWLVLRCTLTAVCLTSMVSWVLERQFGIPVNESLGGVALLISAMGNGWRPVFGAVGDALRTILHKGGSNA